jgi:hypothetical protein
MNKWYLHETTYDRHYTGIVLCSERVHRNKWA